MEHLGAILDTLPLPADDTTLVAGAPSGPEAAVADAAEAARLLLELGADLPAGHLHVWGGPSGAGKTPFLLRLLYGAAARARPVVYATYDLPASTLAMRLLALLADVDPAALPDPGAPPTAPCGLDVEAARRAARVRERLRGLPFYLLPARGFSVASLADRVARAPLRPQVLVVDYVQAVVRARGVELGGALRDLAALAVRQHVAVLGVFRPDPELSPEEAVSAEAARVGWLAPEPATEAGARTCRAEVLQNRYGARPARSLRIDPATGRVDPLPLTREADGSAAPA